MPILPLIRLGVLGATTVFSIVELGVSAHLISQTQQYFNDTATFSSLALAVAVISLVTLPIMLIVDFVRRGAFASMIVVELVWLSILWILWVAAAGETVNQYNLVSYDCSVVAALDGVDSAYYSALNGMCQQVQVVEAFAFVNFCFLLLYTIVLFIVAVVAASRGTSVWFSSVKESFGSSGGPVEHPMTQYNASAPPQSHTAGSSQVVTPAPAAVAV